VSITLCVRADDPQVEKLLAFLDAQPLGSAENKIWLLGRAQKWLSASIAVSYDTATVKAPHSSQSRTAFHPAASAAWRRNSSPRQLKNV